MASIRKRGETYTITAYLGYDENYKQVKKTTTFRPPNGVTANKAEKLAKEYAIIWEQKIRGYTSLDENRTFRELITWFLETIAPTTWRESTFVSRNTDLNAYVLPKLGHVKLKDITPQMLDNFFSEMQKNGRVNGEKPLSAATVGRTRQIICTIFSAACRKEIMTRNPCKLTTPLTMQTYYKAQGYLNDEQAVMLLEALETVDTQFRLAITLLLFTGCRGGEICALRWACVDFENNYIYIEKTLTYIPRKGYSLEPPKTRQSERYIAIPQFVMDLLKEHKNTQIVTDSAMQGMCFIGANGGFYGEAGLNKRFKKLAKQLGFPENVHLHSLRHTAASIMINSDIPTRVISEQLGHATTVITENVYGHVFAQSKIKAMQAIEMKLKKQ